MLVVGTGRCGSTVFAKLLKDLGIGAVHESTERHKFFVEHWFKPTPEERERCLSVVTNGGALVGYPFIAFVDDFRAILPEMKVICLHRDKEEFVVSAKKAWRDQRQGLPLKENLDDYWERYEALMKAIPEPVLHLNFTKDRLNVMDTVEEFLK